MIGGGTLLKVWTVHVNMEYGCVSVCDLRLAPGLGCLCSSVYMVRGRTMSLGQDFERAVGDREAAGGHLF